MDNLETVKIGFFDSGIGGLSVLHCARKMIPNAHFIYYADEEHVPYGEKNPAEVKNFMTDIFQFMLKKNVDVIVIACNTATSIVDQKFREMFAIPIIGMEPAVKKAIDLFDKERKRILVVATPNTIEGVKFKNLVEQVDTNNKVDYLALPKLVYYAEKGDFDSQYVMDYLQNELKSFCLESYGTIVLGCTHFNYFKECFQRILHNEVHFIDGNEGTVHQLIRRLPKFHNINRNGSVEFFFSGKKNHKNERLINEKYMVQLNKVFDIN
ncbi:MAG: murI [Eubacterium sp.]|jgi:glutamate racemase|nr:murI [Eubacterium sp.]